MFMSQYCMAYLDGLISFHTPSKVFTKTRKCSYFQTIKFN